MDQNGDEKGKEPRRDAVTQADLQKAILAETEEVLKRERENIVRAAHARLRKERGS